MSPIIPFISIMICTTLTLITIYSYLYSIEKKAFAKLWTIAWVLHLSAQLVILLEDIGYKHILIEMFSGIFFVLSTFFLIKGTYAYLGKEMSNWWNQLITFIILSFIVIIIFNIKNVSILFLTIIIVGCCTLWSGILLLMYCKEHLALSRALGISFILWGIHKLDYLFLQGVPIMQTWGYIISMVLGLIISILSIFIYFEKIRTQLIEAQNEIVIRESYKFKSEFFTNLSHELKTPINVILASTQLMELYNKNNTLFENKEKVIRNILSIKQSSFRLLKILNNLIDVTKAEAGFFELNLDNYNIVSIIEELTLSVVDYVSSKNIYLEFDTDIEEKIMAIDKDKMERVMLNLLSNAVKFTNGEGKIFVNIYDEIDSIKITVCDTGIGIEESQQDKIFERYKQVNESLSRNAEGNGIGLSLVKSLVELHGGNISVESEYGHGSEFVIKLPVRIIEDKPINNQLYNLEGRKSEIEFSNIC